MSDNMYCKIYVDSHAEKARLLDLIAVIISGSIKMRTVSSPEFEVDLVVNEEFDEARRVQNADQFLFYRYYLDIEPTECVRRERYVESVSNLLEGLWRSGCKAIAACDFENELPRRGGYETSS
jgi:hypothetical protein